MTLFERIDRLLEVVQTFPELLEVPETVWVRLQEIARSKGYILTDYELRTNDGKTLVTLDTEDSWKQLMTYLELDNLADTPIRELTVGELGKAKAFPAATMKQITMTGNLGAENTLPTADEMREILFANLKPIKASLQGQPQIIKQGASVIIKFNIVTPDKTDDAEIERLLKMNLDKIVPITNLEVKDVTQQ